MIGWRVNVGVGNRPSISFHYDNISEINFLDINKYFVMSTSGPFTLGESSIFNSTNECAIYTESILQDDYFTWYQTTQLEDSNYYYLKSKEIIPSIYLSYPNTTAAAQENPSLSIYYYFPSLGKLIGMVNRSIWISNVDRNGNISPVREGSSGTTGAFSMTSNPELYTIPNYRPGVDLSLSSNYQIIVNQIYSDNKYSIRILSPSSPNIFSDLFSSSSVPDVTVISPDNPYEPVEPSIPGGGNGTFDDESDLIPDSSLPTLSSANTGFTRIYNPTLSQVQDLARYLWTDETLIQTLWNKIKQYFEDPMQAIIGFNLVPVPVPDAGTKNFALMYIDTGVSMNVAASQFVDRDCGTFKLEPYYGSALDYSPYTKVSAYLPFIGVVQLDVDEVMGRTLQVKYRVDICSGSCVAKILVDGNVLYQYSGHCAINIPFAASDFSSYVQAAIGVAKLGVEAAVAASGGPPPVGALDPSQQTNQVITTTQTTETARNPMTGRQITTGTRTTIETRESPASVSSTEASFSALSPANVSNTVGQIMSSKPVVNHSGSFSGNTGYLGVRRPYLIIERPNLCMPQNFQAMNGYPSMITMELSTCKGYTRIQQVQLTGLTATNPEQAEIQELLKSGVIF